MPSAFSTMPMNFSGIGGGGGGPLGAAGAAGASGVSVGAGSGAVGAGAPPRRRLELERIARRVGRLVALATRSEASRTSPAGGNASAGASDARRGRRCVPRGDRRPAASCPEPK